MDYEADQQRQEPQNMKNKKTKPKLKARRMWANPQEMREYYMCLTSHCDPSTDRENTLPVAVIPLDDPVALVDLAATAIAKQNGYGAEYAPKFWLTASAALVAIGVLPRARAKKGRK